jgi:hypothetical protein
MMRAIVQRDLRRGVRGDRALIAGDEQPCDRSALAAVRARARIGAPTPRSSGAGT